MNENEGKISQKICSNSMKIPSNKQRCTISFYFRCKFERKLNMKIMLKMKKKI